MKILIDMNLSPDWTAPLGDAGFEAVHWSHVGDPKASDKAIMSYAKAHGYVIFTHDLDFGAILAATGAETPSVVQIRAGNIAPVSLSEVVIALLRRCQTHLEQGALVCLDRTSERVRILPVHGRDG